MKVTIITPTYNSEKFIANAINSVMNQSYINWEYLIIDDCSNDKTVLLVSEFVKKDNRIKLIQQSVNQGAAVARNEGIKRADGKYIAFLDSDDYWHVDKLKIQIEAMENENLNFTFTDYYIKYENKNDALRFNSPLKNVYYKDIIKFNYIACSTVMFNQEALGKSYMPNIRNRQDWGLWINLVQKNKRAVNINKYLMYYTIRKDSISSNKFKMIKYHWYIYKSYLKFNYVKALNYLIRNIIFHMKNKRR
ncbi:MAG TPA: glycosyltransferase family 2 protein [Bacteroidales bacterium]|nr:glycosyltransferase family 2 protein [Bacteroidales bacterium]